MFSGIVEEIGTVHELGPHHIVIEARSVLVGTRPGDSIAVSGVCLTVTDLTAQSFQASVMPETFRRSNLGLLTTGDRVNLERAVTPETRLGGHIVLGHVDAIGRVLSVTPEEEARLLTVQAPLDIMPYVAMKGSITIDGVSLTVTRQGQDSFSVSLVPYTSSQTTLGLTMPGRQVNLEVDVLARYIERLQQAQREGSGITWDFLREHGY